MSGVPVDPDKYGEDIGNWFLNAVDPEFAPMELLEDTGVVASPGLLVDVRQE